jgi:hypothetical protein
MKLAGGFLSHLRFAIIIGWFASSDEMDLWKVFLTVGLFGFFVFGVSSTEEETSRSRALSINELSIIVVLMFSNGMIQRDSTNPVMAPAITNLGALVLPFSVAMNLEAQLNTTNLEPDLRAFPTLRAPHPEK